MQSMELDSIDTVIGQISLDRAPSVHKQNSVCIQLDFESPPRDPERQKLSKCCLAASDTTNINQYTQTGMYLQAAGDSSHRWTAYVRSNNNDDLSHVIKKVMTGHCQVLPAGQSNSKGARKVMWIACLQMPTSWHYNKKLSVTLPESNRLCLKIAFCLRHVTCRWSSHCMLALQTPHECFQSLLTKWQNMAGGSLRLSLRSAFLDKP